DEYIYWVYTAVDTADSAIYFINAEIADEQGEEAEVWENYSQGQASFEASKNHPFSYIDHYEYAEVGVQHIVPFIKTLISDVSTKVETIVNPDLNPVQFITNRTDTPTENLDNVLDNNPKIEVVYK